MELGEGVLECVFEVDIPEDVVVSGDV